MEGQVLGFAGTVASENGGIMLAWAALVKGAAFDGHSRKESFEMDVTEALVSIDWSPVVSTGGPRAASGCPAQPIPVLIDRILQGAIEPLPRDGVIALAVSASLPRIDLPCGGIMWTEADPDESLQPSVGQISFAKEGLCIWAEQGRWCAVADCIPSDMAAIAQAAQENGSGALLQAVVREARDRGIKALLMVADATGAGNAAGGVAYIAGGEELILSL